MRVLRLSGISLHVKHRGHENRSLAFPTRIRAASLVVTAVSLPEFGTLISPGHYVDLTLLIECAFRTHLFSTFLHYL